MTQQTKVCKSCSLELDITEFRKKRGKCKNCEKEISRLYGLNNKEKERKRYKEYNDKRDKKLKKQYDKEYNMKLKPAYIKYKRGAKKRGYEFLLTIKEFDKITKNENCIYCRRKYERCGIDRICNDIGYKIGNVVPCCKDCNKMKGTMTYNQFINLCSLISKNHRYID